MPPINAYKYKWFHQGILHIEHIQQWNMPEIWNPFHRQNHLIFKEFSNFQRTSSKGYPFFKCSSGLHSKNFLRDTAVTRISFFLKTLMLYEVYWLENAQVAPGWPSEIVFCLEKICMDYPWKFLKQINCFKVTLIWDSSTK